MTFTDFRTVDLSGYDDSEIIYQFGEYPNISYAIGGTDGRAWMTVGEARKRQAQNAKGLPSFSKFVHDIIEDHSGDTGKIGF